MQEDRQRITYNFERWRAISAGILETAGSTFLLLIAVRWFQADSTAKALVAGGGSLGLLLSPVLVSQVERHRWKTAAAAALLAAVGAASFVIMAWLPSLPIFVGGSVLGMAASSASIPLMTQIYQENYPPRQRGRLFSHTVMIRIAAAIIFSHLAGGLLSEKIGYYRWLLLIFALSFAVASLLLRRYPSSVLHLSEGSHPLKALRFAYQDRLFRHTLISWMIMGMANLMMSPMRVEYLANPEHGFDLDVKVVALYTAVIPNISRLLLSPLWGWLFDRMNFFVLRIILNCSFAVGILAFFLTGEWWGLLAGAIVYGISNAGGDVAWSLWVTKFAPPHHVAEYMSVHTFFTGTRGLAAPLIAFHLVREISVQQLGLICMGMIIAACFFLLPKVGEGKTAREAAPVVDKAPE